MSNTATYLMIVAWVFFTGVFIIMKYYESSQIIKYSKTIEQTQLKWFYWCEQAVLFMSFFTLTLAALIFYYTPPGTVAVDRDSK